MLRLKSTVRMHRHLNWFIVALISRLVCDLIGFQKLSFYFLQSDEWEEPKLAPRVSDDRMRRGVGALNTQRQRGLENPSCSWKCPGPGRCDGLETPRYSNGTLGVRQGGAGLGWTSDPRISLRWGLLTSDGGPLTVSLVKLPAEFKRPGPLGLCYQTTSFQVRETHRN